MTKGPRCVGIIMDGNRRWARERGRPTLYGHQKGFSKLQNITKATFSAGVETLVVYAFSTENWKRSSQEVDYLMRLFRRMLTKGLEDIIKEKVRMVFVGQRDRFSPFLQKKMQEIEERTKKNKRGTLAIALSYGGRAEIVAATNDVLTEGLTSVTEESFQKRLWTGALPEPDIIIRTGGDMRLSNFLLWGSAYSELFFTNTYWPDFSEEELLGIFTAYRERERRRGS